MRTARGHVGVPRLHHQRVVDDEHMSILPLNSAIKSATERTDKLSMGTPSQKTNAASSKPITAAKTELRECHGGQALANRKSVSTSSFIAALNVSYHFRVRELSETVLKKSNPCAIRLLTPTRWLRIANAPSKKTGIERPLASLPPPTSQLAIVKSAALTITVLAFQAGVAGLTHRNLQNCAQDCQQDMICTQDHTPPPTKILPVCDAHTAALCSPPK